MARMGPGPGYGPWARVWALEQDMGPGPGYGPWTRVWALDQDQDRLGRSERLRERVPRGGGPVEIATRSLQMQMNLSQGIERWWTKVHHADRRSPSQSSVWPAVRHAPGHEEDLLAAGGSLRPRALAVRVSGRERLGAASSVELPAREAGEFRPGTARN
jgi:hypothetical protein